METLEAATGIPIDGYVEIGFGGFADVVDSLGGVEVCLPKAIADEKAHIDLPAGCQTLDGANSLGYVRAEVPDPRGPGRAERQRQFLGAVMRQAATPSTVLLPTRWWQFTHAAAEGVLVGEDTSVVDAASNHVDDAQGVLGRALSLVVPVASTNASTSAGSAVLWDEERAEALFTMLREGPRWRHQWRAPTAPLGRVAAPAPPSAMALVRGRASRRYTWRWNVAGRTEPRHDNS